VVKVVKVMMMTVTTINPTLTTMTTLTGIQHERAAALQSLERRRNLPRSITFRARPRLKVYRMGSPRAGFIPTIAQFTAIHSAIHSQLQFSSRARSREASPQRKGQIMTNEEHRDAIIHCRNVFGATANKLAEVGQHPIVIIEGGFSAMVQMNEAVAGGPALVAWLRDTADHIEAGLIEAMPMSALPGTRISGGE
jgi:hypothetical protein